MNSTSEAEILNISEHEPLSTFTLEPILRWPNEEARAWLYELLTKLQQDPAACSVLARTLLAIGDEDAAQEQLLSLCSHLARARLIRHGVYPASRPGLPQQLRLVDRAALAGLLEETLKGERLPGKSSRRV